MSSLGLIVSCVEIKTSNQDLLYQVHQGSGTGRLLGCLCYWIGFLHAKWTGRDFGIDDRIAASLPPPIATFLLTAECSASAIVAQQRRCRANTLQLCDHLPAEIYPELRKQLPGIALVQVVHVVGPESVESSIGGPLCRCSAPRFRNPKLKIKELGGTGRIHDWRLSRRIRDSISIPLFLAGGLHAGNVDEAIATVQPVGLDLCSGVRTNDAIDDVKLEALFAAVDESR